jgi:capsular polysaccharide biosynthesis protein
MNEQAVLHALREIPGYIFTTFVHRTTVEDAKAFNEADVVVGLHGGAFSNIAYCRRQTIVIEMNVPEEPGRQCFGYMSHSLQLRYHRYGLTPSSYNGKINDFYGSRNINVNVERFVKFFVNSVTSHLNETNV